MMQELNFILLISLAFGSFSYIGLKMDHTNEYVEDLNMLYEKEKKQSQKEISFISKVENFKI